MGVISTSFKLIKSHSFYTYIFQLQSLVLRGVGCHHAGLLFEERLNIENAFRNRDLPILITTTTLGTQYII